MTEKNINNIEKDNSIESTNESNDISEALNKVDSSLDVADLMEGVEVGSDEISEKRERKGENKGGSKSSKTIKKKKKKLNRPLPSSNVMRRKVIQEMQSEEAKLISQLSSTKNPHQYAEKVKEIRSLRQKMTDFMKAKLETIKDFYLKYFGKKHGVDSND